jgi:hypothetical protein
MQHRLTRVAGFQLLIPALLLAILTCALLTACGGSSARVTGEQEQVTLAQLEQELNKTFAELGIDPAKVVASVPNSAGSQVFDLSATLTDPDGPGGVPATGASLAWTEQFFGDLDWNSEVGWPDIQPLARFLFVPFMYDEPSKHGGCEYWPAGNPEGDASERHSWRLARIDGNRNGEITTADIVPLAIAWNQRLVGYHVYQRGPGEQSFVLAAALEHPNHASIPVRYHWECALAEAGVYEFYVAPYGEQDQDGQASPLYRIDTAAGTVNSQPVAIFGHDDYWLQSQRLDAYVGAATNLDASASYDWDSGIASFRWDFDGDGIIDWDSAEAVPSASSSGQVIGIEPQSTPGKVKVIYASRGTGEAVVSVVVRDAAGWDSEPALMHVEIHE